MKFVLCIQFSAFQSLLASGQYRSNYVFYQIFGFKIDNDQRSSNLIRERRNQGTLATIFVFAWIHSTAFVHLVYKFDSQ